MEQDTEFVSDAANLEQAAAAIVIAEAKYDWRLKNQPYYVRYKGRTYFGEEPYDLTEQLMAVLEKEK